MRHLIETVIADATAAAVESGEMALSYLPETAVERPRDPAHGDWACTIALRLAKELKRSPREIANIIAAHIRRDDLIASVEVAGAGFINLRLSNAALHQIIRDAREQGPRFARPDVGRGRGINIEFISANPTGPMHVGHGRWAALGNAMCNICAHAGWQVTREFYVNDAGNQMDVFGHSVALRYLELLKIPIIMPEASYGGAYVRDIAQRILDEEGDVWKDGEEERRDEHFRERGLEIMLTNMQELCERVGVPFDVWFSERRLYEAGTDGLSPIEAMLATLEEHGFLYEKDGATWFRTTDFTDDKDRVLIKADGSYTYFAPDIAYHLSKFNRGSEFLVNIWGADHHGYIPRMMSACEALGHGGKLEVVLGQLVNLFRDGVAVRMSKRTGEMVTFEELVDEVGADATKYLMLNRSTDQAIDFDIETAKRADASNPVYYVQYAHARICSLLRRAAEAEAEAGVGAATDEAEAEAATAGAGSGAATAEAGLRAATDEAEAAASTEASFLALEKADLSLLIDPSELALARLFLQLEEIIEVAARELAPVRLTRFAEELATSFHSFYTRCQVIGDDKELTRARLYLADATRSVLSLVLSLLGVTAPTKM
jgi:arginyl-tRNA synthetase